MERINAPTPDGLAVDGERIVPAPALSTSSNLKRKIHSLALRSTGCQDESNVEINLPPEGISDHEQVIGAEFVPILVIIATILPNSSTVGFLSSLSLQERTHLDATPRTGTSEVVWIYIGHRTPSDASVFSGPFWTWYQLAPKQRSEVFAPVGIGDWVEMGPDPIGLRQTTS
ncbi:hypothetical protein BC827DRAFT_1158504 [Russula dissimulans]|nr:hypothetical protein BC827DRAFT_1158504 [Russula dissimulans]